MAAICCQGGRRVDVEEGVEEGSEREEGLRETRGWMEVELEGLGVLSESARDGKH